MNVVSYMAGIPAKNKNPEKPLILTNFIEGVNRSGDAGTVHNGSNVIPADVAVLQGFMHEDSPHTPHLIVRKNVLDTQRRIGKRTIIVDSNLFLFMDKTNPGNYLRYSFDGVFPTTAEYCWDNPDPSRWATIKSDLNINVKPWRASGNHILLCMQRNGGWSMKGQDSWQWLANTIKELRRYTDRPIIVRGHPGDAKTKRVIKMRRYPVPITMNNVYFSDLENRTLVQDLQNAWATVVYNSSPSVASAIEGVPVFVFDKQDCQAGDVANTDIRNIEDPQTFDRQAWLEKISMCHWNFEDLKSGRAWKHMKQYANV